MIATPHPKGKRRPIRFLSVCSGIEAASQALIPLGGFKCVGVAEIEPHPCHVLAHRFGASRPINMPRPEDVPTHNADGSHRFPQAIAKDKRERAAAIKAVSKLPDKGEIPNYGDMSRFQEWPDADVDALCGGTPCQSFSVAGLREGLADPRGNLMLTFGAIAARIRPRWLLWENVPGVLSSNGGRDFASFLGLLSGQQIEPPPEGWQNSGIVPGIADAYGVAWRVLDAQHVRTRSKPRAVPQRRRRVFLVGYIGDWTRAAAVLFDAESLRRDPAPRREAGQRPAPTISARPTGGGGLGTDFDLDGGLIPSHDVAQPLLAKANSSHRADAESYVAVSNSGDVGYCLTASAQNSLDAETETLIAVAHALRGEGFDATEDGSGRGTPIVPCAPTLRAGGNLTGGHRPPGTDVDTVESLIPMREAVSGPLTAGMHKSAARMPQEQGTLIPEPLGFSAVDSGGDAQDGIAPTLRAMGHADSHQNGGGQLAVAYSIQAGALRENPEAGPDGVGVQEGHAYTLEARAEVQAVAFAENQRGEVRTSDVAMQLTTGGGRRAARTITSIDRAIAADKLKRDRAGKA